MKIILTIVAVLYFAPTTFAQTTDAEGVERTCMNYLEGFYEGDTSKIHRSLRPSLHKFGFWKNDESQQYESAGQMTFDAAIKYVKNVKEKEKFPAEDAVKKVKILDISKHTAAAKVTGWWGTDYMLLSREGDGWMIEQVLWEGPLDQKD